MQSFGDEGDGDAEHSVEAEFFQDAGVEHRGGGGSAGVGGCRPGVEGEEGNEGAEADDEQGGDAFLRGGVDGEGTGFHGAEIEGAGERCQPDKTGQQDE